MDLLMHYLFIYSCNVNVKEDLCQYRVLDSRHGKEKKLQCQASKVVNKEEKRQIMYVLVLDRLSLSISGLVGVRNLILINGQTKIIIIIIIEKHPAVSLKPPHPQPQDHHIIRQYIMSTCCCAATTTTTTTTVEAQLEF